MAWIDKRVRKNRNGKSVTSWRVRYRDHKGKQFSKSFARKLDADRYRAKIESELATDTWINPDLGKMRYEDWATEWIKTSNLSLKPTTLYGYKSALRTHVLPFFGPIPLAKIGQRDVQRFVSGIVDKGRAPTTVRGAYFIFSKSMQAAADAGMIARSPCFSIDLPKLVQGHDHWHIFTPEEIESLACSIPETQRDTNRAFILLLAYGGLRWSEAIALRRRHIDIEKGRIHIERAVTEPGGIQTWGSPKNGKERTISIPAFLTKALAEHLDDHVEPGLEGLVFEAPNGGVMWQSNFRRDLYRPALKAAKLGHARIHDLRHTCASLMIKAGAHPKAIQQHLGHSSIEITMKIYGHLFDDHMDGVAANIDAAFSWAHEAQVLPKKRLRVIVNETAD